MAGATMQLARACSTCASQTGPRVGSQAIITEDSAIAISATAVAPRLRCTASTSQPAGNWPSNATNVPMLSATPMSVWLQPCWISQTEKNGPNPVCTAAVKKFRPLRPRRLGCDSMRAEGRRCGTGAPWHGSANNHTHHAQKTRTAQAARALKVADSGAGSVPDGAQQRQRRLAKLLVQVDVVLGHTPRGEAPVERPPYQRAIELIDPVHRRDRRSLVMDDEPGLVVVCYLRHRAAVERDDGC